MKKFLVLVVMLCGFAGLHAQDEKVVVNDPNAELRPVGSFDEIAVSGGIDLYLSPDDKETVVVSANDLKLRDRIVTRINGSRLEIYFDNKSLTRWPSNMNLKAYVSFKTLKKLKASGSSDIFVNGIIRSTNFELILSGASDFKGAIEADQLTLNQSGSSDSRISGRAERVNVDVSGASDVKAYEFQVNYCTAEASGASDIQITVQKELNVRASGASDVFYKGAGMIRDIKSSGSSSVKRTN